MDEGGKSATELSQKLNVEYQSLKDVMEELVKYNILDKMQEGDHWIYFLDFEGRQFLELYKKAKQEPLSF